VAGRRILLIKAVTTETHQSPQSLCIPSFLPFTLASFGLLVSEIFVVFGQVRLQADPERKL